MIIIVALFKIYDMYRKLNYELMQFKLQLLNDNDVLGHTIIANTKLSKLFYLW